MLVVCIQKVLAFRGPFFHPTSVRFGCAKDIVSAAGIVADPAKCQQVRDWPVPRDLHELRSFVGPCSHYRRHIQGFRELAAPLYELGTKGTDFEWTERRNEAFSHMKNALTSVPILGFPGEERLWYLDTDASDVWSGAVLSQIQDREEHVIADVSKSLERGRAEVLHGLQGVVGSGPGSKTLQMVPLETEDQSQDG